MTEFKDVWFAIPSHARKERIATKTIPFLERMGVLSRTIVFTAPKERSEYQMALGPKVYVSEGELGVRQNRSAIIRRFDPGVPVIQIDDDVDGLFVWRNEKQMDAITPEEFVDLVETGFSKMSESGARMWGVYPVTNPYFMRPRIRTDLSYIIASFWGYISPGAETDTPLHTVRPDGEKEDFERSLQCYEEDGALIRVEYVAVKHDAYVGSGGLHGTRTKERVHEASLELVERFPGLAHLNTSKKSGWTEVRLRDKRKQRMSLDDLVKEST